MTDATRTLADQARALGARAQLLVLAIDEWARGLATLSDLDDCAEDVIYAIHAYDAAREMVLDAEAEEDDRRANDATDCPICKGAGTTVCFVDGFNQATGRRFGEVRRLPCRTCHGAGQMTDEQIAAYEARSALHTVRRGARMSRGETMMEAAKGRGLSIVEYSHWEQGDG